MKSEKTPVDDAFWARLSKAAERKGIVWSFSGDNGIPDYRGEFNVALILTPVNLDEQYELERVYDIVRDEFGANDDDVSWELATAHLGHGYYPSSLVLMARAEDLERVASPILSAIGD